MNDARISTLQVPPIVKSIVVRCKPVRAFAAFTAEIGRWWPIEGHSVGQGDCAGCGIEPGLGGAVYEVSKSGARQLWGVVTVWEPPHRLAFTWHPGRAESTAQLVEIRFEADADRTRVTLTHSGWEKLGADGHGKRDMYQSGWDFVFGQRYRAHADG